MEEDTKQLLTECNLGCKMAIRSMDQILEYVENEKLKTLITESKKQHVQLERESSELLGKYEGGEKEPSTAVSAMSWMGTELKLMWKGDSHKIAKILMDGCNMGIQSVSEYENKYADAAKESKELAKKLVKEEESLMKKLKEFL
ncbi:MAG: hypothetical protein ACI4FZ_10190 [Lachnospiraceae bacterium]